MPSQNADIVVGNIAPAPRPIVVRRSTDSHGMWEAEVEIYDVVAIGRTPGEAAAHLGDTLRQRGHVDILDVDVATVNALVAKREKE